MASYCGHCFCGIVKFQVNQAPKMMGNCHCKDCQRWTGCAYEPVVVFSTETLKVDGKIQFYESASDRNTIVSRGFCPTCGGAVFNKCAAFENLVMIYAGVLEDPSVFEPTMDFYTSSAQHWNCMLETTKKFEREPKSH